MSTHKPNPDYMAKAATPFDVALGELCTHRLAEYGGRRAPDTAVEAPPAVGEPLPDYGQNRNKQMTQTLSATDPDFQAALAHVRKKAGPMLARLAKR